MVEIRSLLEEERAMVKSLREENDKVHKDAKTAKNQVSFRRYITPLDSTVS